MKSWRRAFTLIELLIVVAIIAILAAIAVPNFLEAQVRSKVSRVKADERTYATAIEAYYVDWNTYPCPVFDGDNGLGSLCPFERSLYHLSTPIAYLTTANLPEPLNGRKGQLLFEGCDILDGVVPGSGCTADNPMYLYLALPNEALISMAYPILQAALGSLPPPFNTPTAVDELIGQLIQKRWSIISPGPDTYYTFDICTQIDLQSTGECVFREVAAAMVDAFGGIYDPTNGTTSEGEVARTGGGILGGK